LWSNPEKSVQFSSPILKAGFLYGLTDKNEIFCLNAQDGKTAWSAPMSDMPPAAGAGAGGQAGGGGPRRGGGGGRGGGYGSLVDAGKAILALTPSSQLVVFEPSGKEFKKLASYKVAESQTHAYPVTSGNRIFIKDKDSVILWAVE
jgi:outer membrane protein assembly factor BamB